MTFAELEKARHVLGLRERATLGELRRRHRELVKQYHPDSAAGGDPETMKEINAANAVIMAYIGEYQFSFAEDEFYEQNPEERVRRQFMDDALWGKA